jgi:hypothetical protein
MGTDFFLNFPVWLMVKIFVIIGILIYLAFALVVVRQVKLMTDTIKAGFDRPIKILAYIHLGFAIFVLIVAILIL